MRTRFLLILIGLALLVGGGVFASQRIVQDGAPQANQPSTVTVRQGEQEVRVSGSGEVAATELPLAFAVQGLIAEMKVTPGDVVEAGQVLATLDDRQAQLDLKAALLNWESLTTPQRVSEAEQQLLLNQIAVTEAQEWLAFVQAGVPVEYYLTQYDQALAEYQDLEAQLSSASARNDRKAITLLTNQLARAQAALEKALSDLEWAENYQPQPHELAMAEARLSLASARQAAQQTLVNALHGAALPASDAATDRNDALLALERANLAVAKARWTLDHMVLAAPTAGTVTQIFAAPGERADGSPVLVLRVLQPAQVRFYLDEADLIKVSTGDRLEIRMEAYPDLVFEGAITRLDPVLVPVDDTLLAQAWGEVTLQPDVTLYPGMSLEVDVIVEE